MSDIPDASDLLAAARDALLRELLPALPGDRRYVGLMIANAIAIADREHRSGGDALREETSRLRELLASVTASAAPQDAVQAGLATGAGGPSAAAAALRRALAAAIRAGAFDLPPQHDALVAHLWRTSADWTAISNPKALHERWRSPSSQGTVPPFASRNFSGGQS
ncbi:MAG: hypothetical protein KGL70_14150 [Betaproteobacteria bacterium]|nr:hypothetical protein [Betaproteobacteria bacterium]